MRNISAPPAAGEFGSYGIVTFLNKGRNIVRGIEYSLGELCEARLQFVLLCGAVIVSDSYARTVYIYVIYAQTCGIKAGLPDASLSSKSLAEEHCTTQGTTLLLPTIGAWALDVEASILHRSA